MKVIVCIPGPWRDQAAFSRAVSAATGGAYAHSGTELRAAESGAAMEAEYCGSDTRMRRSFAVGGQGTIAEEELDAIAGHGGVVYLLTGETGLGRLHIIHNFMKICLDAGGLGVKFENSGTAHSARSWRGSDFYGDTLSLLRAHIFLISGPDHYYSCGMHIFGLPDVAVTTRLDNAKAGYLLTEFNHYHVFESPVFTDGQTFSLAKDAERYRIRLSEDTFNTGVECFANPFGRIELMPIACAAATAHPPAATTSARRPR